MTIARRARVRSGWLCTIMFGEIREARERSRWRETGEHQFDEVQEHLVDIAPTISAYFYKIRKLFVLTLDWLCIHWFDCALPTCSLPGWFLARSRNSFKQRG